MIAAKLAAVIDPTPGAVHSLRTVGSTKLEEAPG
jgi:hypothetical protein